MSLPRRLTPVISTGQTSFPAPERKAHTMHNPSGHRVRAEKLPLFERDGRTPYDPASHTLRSATLRILRRAYRALSRLVQAMAA